MNIVFITPTPFLDSQRVRSLNIIKTLSEFNSIYLISLSFDKQKKICDFTIPCRDITLIYQPTFQSILQCLFFLLSGQPLEVSYCRSKKMKKKVREILHNNKIDLIYIKRMRSVQYIDDSVNVPVVIDSTDAMSLFYKRAFINAPFYKKPLFIEEWFKYWMYEKRMFKKYKNWIYCSEEDIKHVKKLAPPNTNFICIPNGVDLEYFVPRNKIAEKNSLIFSGLMSKFVNIEAALFLIKDIFPLILREIPDAKLYIVGPNPPRSIRKHNSSSIIITGEVKDIREYICKNELVVAPVKTGTGTRNKILQAMALCKPVVSTSLAAEGLDIENKKNIVIADTAREFADRAINMLKISDIRNSIANEGRRLVQEKYDMKIITKKLNSELAEIVKKYHEKRSVYS